MTRADADPAGRQGTSASGPGSAAHHPGGAGPAAQRPGGSDLSRYYADGTSSATVPFPAGEQENSGSLTGHILAQGWTETSAERSSGTLRVVIVLAVALGLLVTISVLVVLLANDALSGLQE
ncbi:hypothetical protein ACQPYA_01700 [Micromonospora sp. CA-263727]|uniref:hypothetical protein n=1 Tax=Micromonospora sp. CA-263727 TaxID=3239967 RepID=UPI003D909260